MATAERPWIGTAFAVAAIGIFLAATWVTAAVLIIPVVAGIMLLRIRERNLLLLAALVIALAACWLATGWGHAAYALFGIALPGLIIAEIRKRGAGLATALLLGSIPVVAAVVIFRELFVTMYDLFVLTLEDLATRPELHAVYPAQQADLAARYLSWWAQHALYYAPALFFTGVVSYYFFGALAGEFVIVRSGAFIQRVPPFTRWKAAEWLIVALGVAAILILSGVHLLQVLGWNALIFLIVLFSIFGISLLEYYMRVARLPVGVRIIVYVVLFVLQFIAGILLPLAALFDAKYDFRKIRAKRFG